MTIMLLNSKVVNICLILSLIISTESQKEGTYESDSIESKELDYSADISGLMKLSSSLNRLELDLTGKLRQTLVYHMALMDTRSSEVCSPLSALLPLGKLAMGTSSRRYSELRNVMGYRRSKVVKRFRSVMSKISHISSRVQLTIASRIYVSDKYRVRPEFDKRVRSVFKSSCERVDFENARGTAASINRWIDSETKGLITNLIKEGTISRDTSLLLTNVIYFKGLWKDKFGYGIDAPFYAPNKQRTVKMMSRRGQYKYVKSDKLKAEIVSIPYSGRDVSFVVVLPTERGRLPSLLRELMGYPKHLNYALSQMKEENLEIYLPKFKIYSNLDLGSLYFKLGLKEIFKPNNPVLTKVLKRQKVHVSNALHAAVIEVNEYGTEAAAATVVEAGVLSAIKGEKEFRANHPFLFFVVANGEQLFGGIYTGE